MLVDFMNMAVYDKVYDNGKVDFASKTGRARTESISGVLKTIADSPITLWGVGYDELNNMGLEGCAGLLYLLLAIGILPYSILFGFCFGKVVEYNIGLGDVLVDLIGYKYGIWPTTYYEFCSFYNDALSLFYSK